MTKHEQNTTLHETSAAQLPVNFVLSGTVENTDVKVYIHQKAYKAIEKYAHSDTTKELGSILVGDYTESSGKIHVVIKGAIEAKYTDASASTLTFTHETWDYIHKEQARLFPDLKILGWQHTHPGYGIFLSNYDMFIQENFFNLSFQVAYVVDPKQDMRGFFQWKNGKVEKLNGFYIFDEVGAKITIEPDAKTPTSKVSPTSGRKTLALMVAILLIIAAMSASSFVVLRSELQEQARLQEGLKDIVTSQQSRLQEEFKDIIVSQRQETLDQRDKLKEELREEFAESLQEILAKEKDSPKPQRELTSNPISSDSLVEIEGILNKLDSQQIAIGVSFVFIFALFFYITNLKAKNKRLQTQLDDLHKKVKEIHEPIFPHDRK
ncbi:hypothetical protein AGMMS49957_15220 [Synergistales bacterium]|nr:hypothetical protein AGMMS49957_15220 [Synergistales bacterium]